MTPRSDDVKAFGNQMTGPILTIKATQGAGFSGFVETARWSVHCDDEYIGDVWRADDARGRKCWLMDVPGLREPQISEAVGAGYSATTRKGVVAELVDWQRHRHMSFELDGIVYRCARQRDRGCDIVTTFFAEFPEGVSRWINVTQVIDAKPFMGAMAMEGWYASVMRGRRLIQALYASSIEEAISLIRPEISVPASKEELRSISVFPVRIIGSLARHQPSAAPVVSPLR
jgi:hypothetical protein